jgi:histidyl-tRNA synthetase
MDYDILPGVFDILPENKKEGWRSSALWQKLEELIRTTCQAFGYEEIRTPIFERSELFLRSSGETTDIVSKELYRFVDKGERDVALRPEGTAPALRLFKDQDQEWQKHHRKLFYMGPMFRYDRPQAGRYRQFHQFGVEVLGASDPEVDVEVIDLLFTLFSRIGLKGLKLELNSLGTLASRENYLKGLVEYYTPFLKRLSLDSVRRLETNPLRILDSKDPHDKEINKGAPSILEYLDEPSKAHFEKVKEWLTKLNIPFVINPNLVRGLDYYNQTVFEVVTDQLGSQNSVGGGGRFDSLLKMLGGPDLPGFGFAAGLERVIQTILKQEIFFLPPKGPELVVIPLGEKSLETGYQLVRTLRQANIASVIDFSKKKLSKRLQEAHDIGAERVIILGDEECEKGEAKIKIMESGKELLLPLSEIPSYLSLETKLPSLSQESKRLSELSKTKSLQETSSDLANLSKKFDTIHQNLKNLSVQSMDTNA